jgi:hypothetical protein
MRISTLAFAALAMAFTTAAIGAEDSGSAAALATEVQELVHRFEQRRTYEGPPLTLDVALDEALRRNPELVALRAEFEAARHRPAQERFLAPPTFEAQIWQWPINTLNPANTNMYMFMVGQDFPGFGKRRLRAAVAQ